VQDERGISDFEAPESRDRHLLRREANVERETLVASQTTGSNLVVTLSALASPVSGPADQSEQTMELKPV
jgi:hypothetical protein